MRTILLVLTLLWAGHLQAADKTIPPLLVIGDSISSGYRGAVTDALNEQFAVTRIPVNGKSTTFALEHLDEWLGETAWHTITFNWGLHDLKNSTNDPKELDRRAAIYSKQLLQLVDRLEQTNAQLIWVTTTPVPEPNKHKRLQSWVNRFNLEAARIMSERGIPIANTHDVIAPIAADNEKESRNEGMRDVHFTKEGYQIMAEVIVHTILEPSPNNSSK